MNRREFLCGTAAAAVAAAQSPVMPILDIHQHTNYSGRPDDVMLKHQETMGITKTILLPAGKWYDLEAGATGNERVWEIVRRYPDKYICFANEVPSEPEAREVIEKYLKMGARGIGEEKFFIDCTGKEMSLLCDIAQAYHVPILMHFQHERYNVNFDQFYRTLERYPKVNFIGHAQTWWSNIDLKEEQPVLYPKWKVTAGGWTDRYLRDYPNMYGDMSAGSGLNAMKRDEDHAREFLKRHQDKLLFGSDCSDHLGSGPKCLGAQQIAEIKKLAPPGIQKKIFWDNAAKIIKLT
jgi:predicted TIM-barrel fold metal-dependent hydrolase